MGQAQPPTPPRKCRLAARDGRGDLHPLREIVGEIRSARVRPSALPDSRRSRTRAGSMTKNGTPATETSPNLCSVTVSSRSSSRRKPRRLSARVGLTQIDHAELLASASPARKLRMSRSASAPSASNPSGMSERRVFSRLAMSSFLIVDVAGRAAQRDAGGVLARDHADERLVLARRDVPLPEARDRLHGWDRRCAPAARRGVGADAVQRRTGRRSCRCRRACGSVAQAPVNSALPLRRVARLLDLGQQRRNDVALGPARPATACRAARRPAAATCLSGCVRSRATLAGPRLAAVTLPSLSRPAAPATRRAASGSDRTAGWSWCAPAPRPARHRHPARRRRRARRSGRPWSDRRHRRVGQHRRDRGERLRAACRNREQAAGAVDAALVARRGVAELAQQRLRRSCRPSRSARRPCPTSPRPAAPPPSWPDRRAASAGPAVVGASRAIAPPSIRATRADDARLERGRVRPGAGGGNQQPRRHARAAPRAGRAATKSVSACGRA